MLHMSTLKNIGPYALEEAGNNIILPYSGHIPGGISNGTEIVISGRTHPNFDRFSINLCIGPTCEQDTALHFNPRFSQRCVVRNHRQGGNWGMEETAGIMPFGRNHTFEIHIKVERRGYKIKVDGRHFCDFNHRLPESSVQYIYISGDVNINFIQFRGGSHPLPFGRLVLEDSDESDESDEYCPMRDRMTGRSWGKQPLPSRRRDGDYNRFDFDEYDVPVREEMSWRERRMQTYCSEEPILAAWDESYLSKYSPVSERMIRNRKKKQNPPGLSYPAPPSYPSACAVPSGPFYSPPIPFWAQIPGGLYPGKIIYVSGTPNPNPSRFTVNLFCGGYDSADIALHFDARFKFGSDRNQVIRTHRQGGNYGPEEKHIGYFPFSPNAPFEMMILCEPSSFKIAVNNQHFTEFYYRIQPLQRVTHINIERDVRLSQVRFQ